MLYYALNLSSRIHNYLLHLDCNKKSVRRPDVYDLESNQYDELHFKFDSLNYIGKYCKGI